MNSPRRLSNAAIRTTTRSPEEPFDLILRVIVIGFAIAIPLFCWPRGADPFGIPKEVLFRAEAILLLGIATISLFLGWLPLRFDRSDTLMNFGLLIMIWWGVASLLSSDIVDSLDSLLTVAAGLVIALATRRVAAASSGAITLAIIGTASANAALAILQETGIWNPFAFGQSGHEATTAFLGNPNMAGTFLSFALLVALADALSRAGSRRAIGILFSTVIFAGIVATLALSALIASLAGIVTLLWLAFPRHRFVSVLSLAVMLCVFLMITPVRAKIDNVEMALRQGRYDEGVSNRLIAYLAAFRMTVDHPGTGVGPGRFAFHYFDTKIEVEEQHPELFPPARQSPLSFATTHNDHLQAAAEGGIPAWLLLAGSIVYVARGSFRNTGSPPNRDRAVLLCLPLAVTFTIIALAQFPLHFAAGRHELITAVVLGLWGKSR